MLAGVPAKMVGVLTPWRVHPPRVCVLKLFVHFRVVFELVVYLCLCFRAVVEFVVCLFACLNCLFVFLPFLNSLTGVAFMSDPGDAGHEWMLY